MMKIAIVFALFFAATFALRAENELQTLFTNWMQFHSKSYNHDEFARRYNIFKANQKFVDEHNALGRSYTVGMNKFADLTNEEFRKLFNGVRMPSTPVLGGEQLQFEAAPTADAFDWRTKGAVTGVKDQGQCGSCWSFSTTGSTEGANFLGTNTLTGLSEQNLVDCSGSYGNYGCNGGLMTSAMQYIIANGGIDTESSYPYTAQDGNCQFSTSNIGGKLSSFQNVPQGNENALQASVQKGPTSVAIDASHQSFQLYSNGVYDEPNCSSTQLDHGVLAVGWGSSSGDDYWIVKNSWGTGWGQQGYIWMSRNKNNQCGIATMATLPIY